MSRKTGFTLVELMVVIAIIGILSTTVLFALMSADRSARAARTEATVAKLHTLVMDQYESYRTRRVPISTSGMSPQQAATQRLTGVRNLMIAEMPDRWKEVTNPPATTSGLSIAYQAYHTANSPDVNNQSAECLFMIVLLACADGQGMELFRESEIGDIDEDGAFEFHDAWGQPISWVRWPAGFITQSELMSGDSTEQHDPFDPNRVHPEAYRLMPLIYSGGPDKDKDIVADNQSKNFMYMATGAGYPDPYVTVDAGQRMGAPFDSDGDGERFYDNIHNHLIDAE